jgi:hypothetical protein
VSDFKNAGQNAFSTQVSFDFKRLGLEGVTAYGLFVHGWGNVNPSTKDPAPDSNEFDVDFQWRLRWSFLRGLSFRTRYGVVYQYESQKKYTHEIRLIANYDFPLL